MTAQLHSNHACLSRDVSTDLKCGRWLQAGAGLQWQEYRLKEPRRRQTSRQYSLAAPQPLTGMPAPARKLVRDMSVAASDIHNSGTRFKNLDHDPHLWSCQHRLPRRNLTPSHGPPKPSPPSGMLPLHLPSQTFRHHRQTTKTAERDGMEPPCADAQLDASGILSTIGHVIRCGCVCGLEDAACHAPRALEDMQVRTSSLTRAQRRIGGNDGSPDPVS